METNIKTLISDCISSKYGYNNYLLYDNFDTNTKDANEKITKLFSSIQSQIASHSLDPVSYTHLDVYKKQILYKQINCRNYEANCYRPFCLSLIHI